MGILGVEQLTWELFERRRSGAAAARWCSVSYNGGKQYISVCAVINCECDYVWRRCSLLSSVEFARELALLWLHIALQVTKKKSLSISLSKELLDQIQVATKK